MKKLLGLPGLLLVLFLSVVSFNSQAQSSSEIMKLLATEMNKMCPENCGDGLVIKAVAYQNNFLVFTITNDESSVKMSDVIANRALFKEQLLETLSEGFADPMVVALLKDTNTGFKFNIKGTKSGQSCLITVTCKELLEAFN